MLELIAAETPMDPTIRAGTTSYYDLKAFIDSPNATLLVAELNGELVGSGYAKIMDAVSYKQPARYGYLGFMFVPTEHRGKGINGRVTQKLIDWCKSKGLTEIQLDVYDVNEAAVKAYKKAGFKPHLLNMRLDS